MRDEVRGSPTRSLHEAARAAGLPIEAVEQLRARYYDRVDLERMVGEVSLRDARRQLRDVRVAIAAIRQAARLDPVVEGVARMVGYGEIVVPLVAMADHLAGMVERGERRLEGRAAELGFARGGNRRLLRLMAPTPLVWLAAEAKGLMGAAGQRPTSTVGGPLFLLVAAIHDAETGQGEKGVASALRQVCATSKRPRGRRDDAAGGRRHAAGVPSTA